jgi:hypothetical protein
MENFRMDRTVVSKSTFEEADDHVTFYKDKTPLERLEAACSIINQIFQVSPDSKMDKTVIQSRKHAKSI